MNKHYLIGAFSKGKLAQPYFDSLPILGDSVEPIMVQYLHKGEFERITIPENVRLIKYKKEYPGNTGKHKDFAEVLAPLLTRDAWCIVTDVHDVVFQAQLPAFPDTVDSLVVFEGKKFDDVDYWQEMFPRYTAGWDAYNVGCFAMKREILLAFWDYLHRNWMEFYGWYRNAVILPIGNGDSFPFNIPFHHKVRVDIAVMFNAHYDTLCFNEFIRKQAIQEIPELFACYAYQVEKGIVSCKEGQLYRQDNLVSIAHFNGNTKKHMIRKEEA
jgi:hypothetical protein